MSNPMITVKMMLRVFLLSFLALPLFASDTTLVLKSADGSSVKPLELTGKKAAVFIFYLQDCPICNAYAPEIERIRTEYAPKDITLSIVQTDPKICAADA